MHCLFAADTVTCRHICLRILTGASYLVPFHLIGASLTGVPLGHIPSTAETHIPIVPVLCWVRVCRAFHYRCNIWNGWRRNVSANRRCWGCCCWRRALIIIVASSPTSFSTIVVAAATSTPIRLLRILLLRGIWYLRWSVCWWRRCIRCRRCADCWGPCRSLSQIGKVLLCSLEFSS